MSNYIKNLLVPIFLFSGIIAYGQQQNNYIFYRQNMNFVNAAYVGADGETTFTGLFRSQWQGVEHAPESQAFSFGAPVVSKVGLGLSVENDRTFIEKQTSINIDFSYKLPITDRLNLFLGLKAGGNFYAVNTSGLKTWNYELDPSLINLSRFNPNLGVGAYLKDDKFYVSLSAPRILKSTRAREEEGTVTTAADRVHFYLSGGYDFVLNKNFILKPSFMMKYVKGAPLSTDFTALLNIHNSFSIGGAFRTDKVLSGLAIINVFEWLELGYAYESSIRSELKNSGDGTHELLLKFTL